jgi:hypothetical protein
MLEQAQQQLTNEPHTEPTNKLSVPPVEELRDYSRCQKNKIIPDATCQTSNPNLGNTTYTSYINSVIPVVNYTSLPVAQRKGVRSCTQHLISYFVFYQHLSSPCHSFVSKLSSMPVPRNVQDALSDPKWMTAIQEKMKALHKNKT